MQALASEDDTRQELATLKKGKRDRLVQIIVNTNKQCAATHKTADTATIKECFKSKVKTQIKQFFLTFRAAQKSCTGSSATAIEKELCALRILRDSAPIQAPAAFNAAFEVTACPFKTDDKGITCGFVTVPEKRSSQENKTIKLAVAVLKSTETAAATEPVFYLEGGPGVGSLDSATDWETSPLRDKHDIILFDQRGTGFSEPELSCPEYDAEYLKAMQSAAAEDMTAMEVAGIQKCLSTLEAKGIDLSAYNSVEGAQDIDAIRLALGYDTINLFGSSYGTRLALTAMRDTPRHIRSVILDSVLPLQENFFAGDGEIIINAFTKIFSACREDDFCNKTYPTFEKDFNDLFAQVEKRPVVAQYVYEGKEYRVTVGPLQLFTASYRIISSSEGITYLPQFVAAAKTGDFTAFAGIFTEMEAMVSGQISEGAHYATVCNEEYEPVLPPAEVKPGKTIMSFVTEIEKESAYNALCSKWKYRQVPPAEYLAVSSDIPTLILTGEFDPITPAEWATEAAKTLPKSVVLTFPVAHGELTITEGCAADIAEDFFAYPDRTPNSQCMEKLQKLSFEIKTAESEQAICYRKVELGGDFRFHFRFPVTDQATADKIGCYYVDFEDSTHIQGIHYLVGGELTDNENDGYASTRLRYPKEGQAIISYFSEDNLLATDIWGAHSISIEQSKQGVTRQDFDENGDGLTNDDGFLEFFQYVLDNNGYRKTRVYLDKDGKKLTPASGAYERRYEYDADGNVIKVSEHDKNGALVETPSDGIAFTTYTYDKDGNEIKQVNFGKEGQIKTIKDVNYAEIRAAFDAFGNETHREYLDAEGKVTAYSATDPTAVMEWKYNAIGQVVDERYLSTERTLVKDPDLGYAILKTKYNDQGREIEVSIYDEQEQPIDGVESGVARTVFKYDDAGVCVELRFYDQNGQLVNHKEDGYAVLKYKDDLHLKMIFLDKDGKEVPPPKSLEE